MTGTRGNKGKKERIIAMGRKLFMQQGIDNTSMEQIAAQVPVSKMTIYKYFQSKEGLLEQVMDEFMEEGKARFEHIVEAAADPIDAFMTMIKQFKAGTPEFSDLFMQDLVRSYPAQMQKIVRFKQDFIVTRIEQLVFRGQQMGVMRKDISPHVFVLYMLSLNNFFSRPEALDGLTDISLVGEQIYNMLFFGIASPDYKSRMEGKQE